MRNECTKAASVLVVALVGIAILSAFAGGAAAVDSEPAEVDEDNDGTMDTGEEDSESDGTDYRDDIEEEHDGNGVSEPGENLTEGAVEEMTSGGNLLEVISSW